MARSTRACGLIFVIPLLMAMGPAPAARDCRSAEGGAQTDPILLSGIESGRRVHVEIDAVVAEEVVQIGLRGFMLPAMLRLPEEGLAFPAGTVLRPDYASRQPLCLPLAPPAGPEGARWRDYGRGRLACLIDSDGTFEQVVMHGTDYAMHVPQARPYRTITLPAPIRLAQNPLGRPETRRQVLRRIEIGEVTGDKAVLRVLHAFRDPQGRERAEADAWDSEADGTRIYRLPAPTPLPIDRSDSGWSSNASEQRTIDLVQDAEVEVGGLRLRIERPSPSRPAGWNIVPLASHFPRWIHYGCGGSAIRLGAAPDPEVTD